MLQKHIPKTLLWPENYSGSEPDGTISDIGMPANDSLSLSLCLSLSGSPVSPLDVVSLLQVIFIH